MIKVENISKSFTKYEKEAGLIGMLKGFFNAKKVIKTAVDNISFEIQAGEIVGYIGANGAGKSTTIKMLTGILTPTSGVITVDGIVPYEERTTNAANIGVVFGQKTQLWWDLPLIETYSILKEVYNLSDDVFKERMDFFNKLLGLEEFIKSPVRTLSLGQRMRADIVASLLHNPRVLYLDEPTIGLDVAAKHKMRDAIKEMNKKFNTTVILTTHDLDDIEELCNRIMIIDNGKIIYDGTLEQIKNNYGYMKTVSFEIKENVHNELDYNEYFKIDSDSLKAEVNGNSIKIIFNKNMISVSDITHKIMKMFYVTDIVIEETDIETIVSNIYDEGKVIVNE